MIVVIGAREGPTLPALERSYLEYVEHMMRFWGCDFDPSAECVPRQSHVCAPPERLAEGVEEAHELQASRPWLSARSRQRRTQTRWQITPRVEWSHAPPYPLNS